MDELISVTRLGQELLHKKIESIEAEIGGVLVTRASAVEGIDPSFGQAVDHALVDEYETKFGILEDKVNKYKDTYYRLHCVEPLDE